MKQHSFGPLPPVSTLTLGGGGLGTAAGRATTVDECVATVHAAVAAGITLLADLAPRIRRRQGGAGRRRGLRRPS